jgi:probable HAF family extracellular repeat protein
MAHAFRHFFSSIFGFSTAILFSMSLVACGGGGSSDSSGAQSDPPPGNSTSSVVDPNQLPLQATNEDAPAVSTPPDDSPPPATGPAWTVTDLTAQFGENSRPAAMNDNGEIVGVTSDPNGTRSLPPIQNPFLLSNGQLTDLGHLDGRFGGAVDINNAGQIAGYSYVSSAGQTHAFVHENGTMTDIGALIGPEGSWAAAMNGLGHIAVFTNNGSYIYSNGAMNRIKDDKFGHIAAINDSGQIAGTTRYNNQFELAAFYDGSTTITLGSLPGTSSSQAVALNNVGQIAGFCYTVGIEGYRAFLYSNGVMQELFIPGGVNGAALAINNAGDVVGWSAAVDGNGRAFLHRNGQTIDLNNLPGIAGSGWILQTALEINNAGQIIVSGSFNGQRRYALLTPP